MKIPFLDLGRQPLANGFLSTKAEFDSEFFFDMKVVYDSDTYLVSLEQFVKPELMFNDHYAYHGSMSKTMQDHFFKTANKIQALYEPDKILEIGSNDGVFIKHFDKDKVIAVEPCSNFAKITNDLNIKTYPEFWNINLAEKILEKDGRMDVIFAANCMCHIPDLEEAFQAVAYILQYDGVFIFEDPSLLQMIQKGSYDQIYDEHAHIFSVIALDNILHKVGMEIYKIEALTVHGGSNRIYARKTRPQESYIDNSVIQAKLVEKISGLTIFDTYLDFAYRVGKSRYELLDMLQRIKAKNKKVICYGAASKTTTIFNYCGIDTDLIEYIVDTTPSKIGKYSPGMHIPIIHPSEGFNNDVDFAFLGAWNFATEICEKEKDWKGRFITHVPTTKVL